MPFFPPLRGVFRLGRPPTPSSSESSQRVRGLRIFWRAGLDLLFPQTCALCQRDLVGEERGLCGRCPMDFVKREGAFCRVCDEPLPDGGARCFSCRRRRREFRFARSAGLYEGALRRAILLFKYAGREELSRPLGSWLADYFFRHPELCRAQCVVPVPLHFLKRHARGYNQSELLAEAFADHVGIPVRARAVGRSRWTWSQARLKREERKRNVAHAFGVYRPQEIRERHVLLIDDVCTTGATLESCARALKAAGAARVDALSLARNSPLTPKLPIQ